jgi:hypothetical protein
VVLQTPLVADHTPPARPLAFRSTVAGRFVHLSWRNPADADFAKVFVVLNARRLPTRPADGKKVYAGTAQSITWKASLGAKLNFAIYAYDQAGNISPASTKSLKLAIPSKLVPAAGTAVAAEDLLRWVPVKLATYYNVQVFQGTKRILSVWPRKATLPLPGSKLKAGVMYTWYVWPGFGDRSLARYGKLIGRSTFKYAS